MAHDVIAESWAGLHLVFKDLSRDAACKKVVRIGIAIRCTKAVFVDRTNILPLSFAEFFAWRVKEDLPDLSRYKLSDFDLFGLES